MKHTSWVDECCCSLREQAQYPTDALIERLIKVRSLHQNISDTLLGDGEVSGHASSVVEMSQAAFENELSTMQAELPALSGLEHCTCKTLSLLQVFRYHRC